MKTLIFNITGADVPELSGESVNPDYPITFTAQDWGERSIDVIAQEEGTRLWEAMHGETPTRVYYRYKTQETQETEE